MSVCLSRLRRHGHRAAARDRDVELEVERSADRLRPRRRRSPALVYARAILSVSVSCRLPTSPRRLAHLRSRRRGSLASAHHGRRGDPLAGHPAPVRPRALLARSLAAGIRPLRRPAELISSRASSATRGRPFWTLATPVLRCWTTRRLLGYLDTAQARRAQSDGRRRTHRRRTQDHFSCVRSLCAAALIRRSAPARVRAARPAGRPALAQDEGFFNGTIPTTARSSATFRGRPELTARCLRFAWTSALCRVRALPCRASGHVHVSTTLRQHGRG